MIDKQQFWDSLSLPALKTRVCNNCLHSNEGCESNGNDSKYYADSIYSDCSDDYGNDIQPRHWEWNNS